MTAADLCPRDATPADAEAIARLWHAGWRDAHDGVLPEALARHRTLESFRGRMQHALAETRAAGPAGSPVAFYMLKDDELYQFYVGAEARGTGLAAALIADAQSRRAASVTSARGGPNMPLKVML